MAGEMTQSEVTRENFPLHFAIADEFGGVVHAFDWYQGPYISIGGDVRIGSGLYAVAPRINGIVRLWVQSDDIGGIQVYNEDNERLSKSYPDDEFCAIQAATEVILKGETSATDNQRG